MADLGARTADPEVKTLADLEGRSVALGPKAGTATVLAEETLKAAGMFDRVDLQYLSFADIFGGLLDGTIDVGLVLSWYTSPLPGNSVAPVSSRLPTMRGRSGRL